MYEYDDKAKNIIKYNNEEEFNIIVNWLKKENFNPEPKYYTYNTERNYLYFSDDNIGRTYITSDEEDENGNISYNDRIVHKIKDIDNKYILKENLKLLEDRIRTLFNNPNVAIVCDTIEEKYNLIKLLDKLEYKTALDKQYKIGIISNEFLELNRFILPGKGQFGTVKLGHYKLINFKDILKEIDLEQLKELYK